MRFVEVSAIEPNILQEWHCGKFALTARSTDMTDRFKVQLCHGNNVLRPEFLVAKKGLARLAARYLLTILSDLAAPSTDAVNSVLRTFASAHGWQESPNLQKPDFLEPIRHDKPSYKTWIPRKTSEPFAGSVCQISELKRAVGT